MSPRELLLGSFKAAVAAADPLQSVPQHLPAPPTGRTLVVGAGKAAASMAKAVENAWDGLSIEGLVVTRYGHGLPCRQIEVVEAAHPVPDEQGLQAARRILETVNGLTFHVLGATHAASVVTTQIPSGAQHAPSGGGGQPFGSQVSHVACQILGSAQSCGTVTSQVPFGAQHARRGGGHGFGTGTFG